MRDSSRCVAITLARTMTRGGVARRPASHVRYDSADTPSRAANAACDFPTAIRHSRSVRGSTTSHHAIAAGRWEARGWGWPYFSQPIFAADRSLFSPAPSPPGAQAVGTIGEFFREMARPAGFEPATLGLEGRCLNGYHIDGYQTDGPVRLGWAVSHHNSTDSGSQPRLCDNRCLRRATRR